MDLFRLGSMTVVDRGRAEEIQQVLEESAENSVAGGCMLGCHAKPNYLYIDFLLGRPFFSSGCKVQFVSSWRCTICAKIGLFLEAFLCSMGFVGSTCGWSRWPDECPNSFAHVGLPCWIPVPWVGF